MSVSATDALDQLVTTAATLAAEVDSLRIENAALKDKHSNKKKLSKSEVGRMRLLYASGDWSQASIADAFDVNPATVSRIVRGIYHP